MALKLESERTIGRIKGPWRGTALLHVDTDPLGADETRSIEIDISHCSKIGGSLYADQACTFNFYYGQDGNNYGDAVTQDVAGGETIELEADPVYSRALKIEVINGAVAMSAYRLHLRGRS